MEVFETIFERIDDVVINDLANGTANLVNVVAPAFQAVFVVYVLFIAWSYWQNASSIESSAIDLVKRVVTWGLILGFSMNLSGYNSSVLPVVLGMGDSLAQVFSGTGDTSAHGLDALATQISEAMANNSKSASEVGGLEKISAMLNATANNTVILVCAGLFLVIASAYFILVKIFLAILAVLGPIFLAFLMFPSTRQFGMNWINQVLNYSLLTLVINIAGGFFISYVDGLLDDFMTGGVGDALENHIIGSSVVIQICLATMLFVIILWKLPELTSSLAGGMVANGFGNMLNTARMGSQLLKGGKGGGGKSGGSMNAEQKGK